CMNPLLPDDPETPDGLDGPDFREASYDDPREPEISFAPAPLAAKSPAISPAAALAAPPARVDPLNLAGRPFLNSRPVVRAALLLWLLGALLLLGNVSLFWSYRQRSADKRADIAKGEAEIQRQQTVATQLQHQLDSINLGAQNQRVEFLNKQIAERTFSWSQLLDRIAERLPDDVRLNRLAPLTGDKAERQRTGSTAARRSARTSELVPLLITGESRSDEALSSFVDNLFKPPFTDANPTREEREEDGKTLKFEISVQYRPGPPPATVPGTAGPAPRIEELPMPGVSSPGAKAPGATAPRTPLKAQRPPGGRP
ncbi:MAG TPA: PilN domain-containing protein, partial [Thermoanaerobaculia bacterium]